MLELQNRGLEADNDGGGGARSEASGWWRRWWAAAESSGGPRLSGVRGVGDGAAVVVGGTRLLVPSIGRLRAVAQVPLEVAWRLRRSAWADAHGGGRAWAAAEGARLELGL